jgi:hypothetical protein
VVGESVHIYIYKIRLLVYLNTYSSRSLTVEHSIVARKVVGANPIDYQVILIRYGPVSKTFDFDSENGG